MIVSIEQPFQALDELRRGQVADVVLQRVRDEALAHPDPGLALMADPRAAQEPVQQIVERATPLIAQGHGHTGWLADVVKLARGMF